MLRPTCGVFAAMFALTMTADLLADDKPAEAPSQRQEILALLNRAETAFANADAKGLAACWTAEGEFVGAAGARTAGRDSIEKLFQDAFAMHKDGKLLLHVQHFRLVNDGLALIDAITEVKPAAATGGPQMTSFVIVKQDGRWLIENARETTVHLPPQSSPLQELKWLVGDWASATSPAGITLHSNCDWTAAQSFLIRRFKLDGKGTFLHGGTEVIGWDPRGRRFRSWVFDSDGGFGENVWVRDGDRWLIKFTGTLADGSEVSSTHILTKVDDDTATLQSKDRMMNGMAQADVPETTLKRQAAAAAPAKADEAPKTLEKAGQ